MTDLNGGCYNPTLQYTNPFYNALNGQSRGIIPNILRAFSGQQQQQGLNLSQLLQNYGAAYGQPQGIIPNMLRTFGVQGGLSGLLNGAGQGLSNLGQSISNDLSGLLGGAGGSPNPSATQPSKMAGSDSNPMGGVFSGLFGS